jgi:small neutral amino acid transporter SnatA (MarC family)
VHVIAILILAGFLFYIILLIGRVIMRFVRNHTTLKTANYVQWSLMGLLVLSLPVIMALLAYYN